jgi:hypothetical protein
MGFSQRPNNNMKHFFAILLAALCAATSYAQTIKTLGFNTTNGQVVANTGTNVLTFTNVNLTFGDFNVNAGSLSAYNVTFDFEERQIEDFESGLVISWSSGITLDFGLPINFGTNVSATRANLGFSTNLNTFWTATNFSNARSAVGLGATWLTNTNVANFRTAIGIGVSAIDYDTGDFSDSSVGATIDLASALWDKANDIAALYILDNEVTLANSTIATNFRNAIGLPLPALTNTSNVTAMRALSGSTNTNHPFSGSVALTNTNVLVFSNGILQSVQ